MHLKIELDVLYEHILSIFQVQVTFCTVTNLYGFSLVRSKILRQGFVWYDKVSICIWFNDMHLQYFYCTMKFQFVWFNDIHLQQFHCTIKFQFVRFNDIYICSIFIYLFIFEIYNLTIHIHAFDLYGTCVTQLLKNRGQQYLNQSNILFAPTSDVLVKNILFI